MAEFGRRGAADGSIKKYFGDGAIVPSYSLRGAGLLFFGVGCPRISGDAVNLL
jgi:hypothetical protein